MHICFYSRVLWEGIMSVTHYRTGLRRKVCQHPLAASHTHTLIKATATGPHHIHHYINTSASKFTAWVVHLCVPLISLCSYSFSYSIRLTDSLPSTYSKLISDDKCTLIRRYFDIAFHRLEAGAHKHTAELQHWSWLYLSRWDEWLITQINNQVVGREFFSHRVHPPASVHIFSTSPWPLNTIQIMQLHLMFLRFWSV